MIDIIDLVYNLLLFIDKNIVIVVAGLIVYYLIISLSLYGIYKKVGLNPNKALIPIYNILSILDFVSLPKFLLILFIVPYVNFLGIIIGGFVVNSRIGRVLKKGSFYRLLLGILPVVFLPLLAVSNNLTYEKIEYFSNDDDEDEKDDSLDLPTYKVDVKEINDLSALSVNELFDSSSPINNTKVVEEFTSDEKGVEDLTFDYNQLYSDSSKTGDEPVKEEQPIDEFKFDESGQEDEVQAEMTLDDVTNIEDSSVSKQELTDLSTVETPVEVETTPVVEDVIPVPTVEPELPVAETPVEIEAAPVVEDVIPVPTVEPELPVTETPVEIEAAPVVEDVIPVPTVEPELPVAETPVEVETTPVVEDVIPVPAVEPELPVTETPVEVETTPVVEDVIPVPTVEPELPVAETPVEVETTPVVETTPSVSSDYTFDYNALYGTDTTGETPVQEEVSNVEPLVDNKENLEPVVEENTKVETSIENKTEDVVEQPVLEDVVVDAVEDIYANVPAPAEPVVEENTMDETSVENKTEDVVEQPVLEDVVVDAVEDIYANVPAPAEPEVKILKDDDTDELLKQSKDGMTLDYNSLYNIETDTTYEEEQRKKEEEEELQKEAEEKGMLAIDPYSAINVAEAPSFDIEEPVVEEVIEPVIEEVEEPVVEDNLVSIDIEEPGLLPVGKITSNSTIRLDKKDKNKFEEEAVNEPVKGPASMGLADLMSTPGSKKNQQPVPTQQPMNPNARPVPGPQGVNPGIRPMNGPQRGNPNMRPAPGPQRGNPNMRPAPGPQRGNPNMRPAPGPQRGNPGGPMIRPQGNQNYGAQPNNTKFISNDRDNYILPGDEPAYVQQPTDPNLRANPMSIFGAGAKAGLRPTSDEAIRQRRRQQNNNQNNRLCPFCGFAVKPGQPRCVMCGRRLM